MRGGRPPLGRGLEERSPATDTPAGGAGVGPVGCQTPQRVGRCSWLAARPRARRDRTSDSAGSGCHAGGWRGNAPATPRGHRSRGASRGRQTGRLVTMALRPCAAARSRSLHAFHPSAVVRVSSATTSRASSATRRGRRAGLHRRLSPDRERDDVGLDDQLVEVGRGHPNARSARGAPRAPASTGPPQATARGDRFLELGARGRPRAGRGGGGRPSVAPRGLSLPPDRPAHQDDVERSEQQHGRGGRGPGRHRRGNRVARDSGRRPRPRPSPRSVRPARHTPPVSARQRRMARPGALRCGLWGIGAVASAARDARRRAPRTRGPGARAGSADLPAAHEIVRVRCQGAEASDASIATHDDGGARCRRSRRATVASSPGRARAREGDRSIRAVRPPRRAPPCGRRGQRARRRRAPRRAAGAPGVICATTIV
jgi:hypothetical protein